MIQFCAWGILGNIVSEKWKFLTFFFLNDDPSLMREKDGFEHTPLEAHDTP